MKKNRLKKYHQDVITKDFTIGFFSGLAAAFSFWFLTGIIPLAINGNYPAFFASFLVYLILSLILFLILRRYLLKTYGK